MRKPIFTVVLVLALSLPAFAGIIGTPGATNPPPPPPPSASATLTALAVQWLLGLIR